MDVDYPSFVHSAPFRFIVGSNRKEHFIHAKLATQLSDAFKTLIDGSMVEAKERVALLEDIEEDTFTRFVEYAYTRDYSVPDPAVASLPPTVEPNGSENTTPPIKLDAVSDVAVGPDGFPQGAYFAPAAEEPEPEFEGWGYSKRGKKKAAAPVEHPYIVHSTPKQKMWARFQAYAYFAPVSNWKPRPNEDEDEIYTPIFQAHARLYVFADRYNIGGLKGLALRKLRCNLAHFTLYDCRRVDIVDLASYTYRNTIDIHDSIDALRELVSDYVVCQLDKIGNCPEFLTLLEEEGCLARDIVLKALPRLT